MLGSQGRFRTDKLHETAASREPGSGIPRNAFRLAPESLLEPSTFEVELVLNGVRHVYGFAVDDERVISEWLHSYPHGRRRVLFERDGPSIDFGATVTQRTRAEVIEDLLTEDTLFLSAAAQLKLVQYHPVTVWFQRSLRFVRPVRRTESERLARFLEQSKSSRSGFLQLARAADTGISDLAVEHIDDPRAAEEAEMLTQEVTYLQGLAADTGSEIPSELAERMRRAQSWAAFAHAQSRRAKLLVKHGGAGFELGASLPWWLVWSDSCP